MSLMQFAQTLGFAPKLLSLGKALKPKPLDTADCMAAMVQGTTAKHPHHSAIVFEDKALDWQQFNALANRYAHAMKALGFKRGDTVSVLMENRVEYLAVVVGLNKLGVCAALINTSLTERPLTHCMSVTRSKGCIVGEERQDSIDGVRHNPELKGLSNYLFVADTGGRPCPSWATDLKAVTKEQADSNLPETAENTLRLNALYIFTSGTTGLPKAAVVSNRRYIMLAQLSALAGLQCDLNDRIYLCLPLYHGTGLFLGVGAAFSSGASMFIRRKFSASAFLSEVREHDVTCFVYIGEICRYLLDTPERPDDSNSPLGTALGNGLRPDIWHQFKNRFGISRVAEFYGASEGNIGIMNLLNKDCTVGTTTVPHTLIRYDVDADEIIRNSEGYCVKAAKGEPGLLLGKITELTAFEGYTDEDATRGKILRDVYEKGDAYFNSGDLLRTVDVGFAFGLPHYQFVDRVGDTFRWKGENVSTNEVGEIINTHSQVQFSNVYGVTLAGTDGRAGMAALLLSNGVNALDLESFSAHIKSQLPAYARPLFLRILPDMDTTGTFKMVKGELRKEGFDQSLVQGPIFVLKPGADQYQPLTTEFANFIKAGKAGY